MMGAPVKLSKVQLRHTIRNTIKVMKGHKEFGDGGRRDKAFVRNYGKQLKKLWPERNKKSAKVRLWIPTEKNGVLS